MQTRSEEQKKRAIKELPSLLEFYGFVYFFGSFLAGPAIEIREYLNYTDLSVFNDKVRNGT
jgi:lysophospholipid acyltransferase